MTIHNHQVIIKTSKIYSQHISVYKCPPKKYTKNLKHFTVTILHIYKAVERVIYS